MACPVCSASACVGGWVGGYFGIHPPKHTKGRILSAVITSSLITITVIALKTLFDISLCRRGGTIYENIVRVGIKTMIMGMCYSIGVNYLLNRYIYPPIPIKPELGHNKLKGPSCLSENCACQ